jgi:hypothetical protein
VSCNSTPPVTDELSVLIRGVRLRLKGQKVIAESRRLIRESRELIDTLRHTTLMQTIE